MFTRDFFTGKKVTVMGLGLNEGGVGTVRFLAERGAREIIVTDIKTEEELSPSVQALRDIKNIRFVLGGHAERDFIETDIVVKNPALPWTNPFIRIAKEHGIPVTIDSAIFLDLCEAPVIGVTGTKGKTTTASLIAHILESDGRKVARVGISRKSVLGEFEKIDREGVVVFELSSWRLSALEEIRKSPTISVITNIYPDHQNYYDSMEAYVDDKKNIFRFQSSSDTVVLNADNAWTAGMGADAPGHVAWFSSESEMGKMRSDGFFLDRNRIIEVRDGISEEMLEYSGKGLLGAHNRGNILAAVAAASTYGVRPESIRAGIDSFPGVPHRLELVRERRGVSFYNDSAATIPEATISALRSFSSPVYLIAGGSDKNLDFDQLACAILERAKGIIFLKGIGTEKLLEGIRRQLAQCGRSGWRFEIVESMGKAVELAARSAEPGDVVLLSPGTASFGLFKNEFDRGDQFRDCVANLRD